MANQERTKLARLVGEAMERPVSERRSFVCAECEAGPARDEALSLLEALESADGFMARPTLGNEGRVAPDEADHATPGACVGRYKLLELIGEGGFGRVFLAQQRDPVVRQVAVKVIKVGMDSAQVVARFEAERQALAMMDHPGIATVFDGGVTESGRPYFAMELVRGAPIVQFCDARSMPIRERLTLFRDVCGAVHHAHQKGVIHRDLKPANLLVTERDGRPSPKIIDFGIAKAISGELTNRSFFTEFRQFLGTPQYMSPEQTLRADNDLDTRSDIYSLGVILYELLTGTTPLDLASVESADLDELQRLARESETPRPSLRLSTLDTLAKVAEHRRCEPASLGLLLRGDLDWIVLKTLERDRNRRYDSAAALSDDLGRYLADEPVAATPPSVAYRARKFVRRNRGLVAAGTVVAATLVLGVIGTSVGLFLAMSAHTREEGQRRAAEESARRASDAEAQANARAAELERVAAFQAAQLKGIDPALMGSRLREDLIAEAKAAVERSGPQDRARPSADDLARRLADLNLTNVALKTLDRNIFQRAEAAIDAEFADQPLVAARLFQTSGDTLGQLGLYDQAIRANRRGLEILRREVGDDDARTLEAINSLGYHLTLAGEFAEAEGHVRAALEGRRRLLGEDASGTLGSLTNLGSLLAARGKYAQSEEVFRDDLARLRQTNRADDEVILSRVMGELAITLMQQGKNDEADPLLREAIDMTRRLHGEESTRTLAAKSNLAAVLRARGKLPEATTLALEVLAASRVVLGDEHPSLLEQVNNVGVMLAQQNRIDEATVYQIDALARLERQLGEAHPSTLTALNNVAVLLIQRGKFVEAGEMLADGVLRSRKAGADALPILAMLLHHQADALRRAGRLDEARLAARESVDLYRAHADWNPSEALHAEQVLEEVLTARHDHAEVEPLLRASVERARSLQPANEPRLAGTLGNLGANLLSQKKYAEAEAPLRECVEISLRIYHEGEVSHWRSHHNRSMLGESLVGQADALGLDSTTRLARLREAEPILIDAYTQLRNDPRVPAPTPERPADRRRQALQRIVELYEAWDRLEPGQGHAATAEEWRRRAGEAPAESAH